MRKSLNENFETATYYDLALYVYRYSEEIAGITFRSARLNETRDTALKTISNFVEKMEPVRAKVLHWGLVEEMGSKDIITWHKAQTGLILLTEQVGKWFCKSKQSLACALERIITDEKLRELCKEIKALHPESLIGGRQSA